MAKPEVGIFDILKRTPQKPVKLGIVFIVTISLICISASKVNAQGCNETEWNNISKKYNLEEQFSKMQEVVDTSPLNQALYNQLTIRYEQSLTLAGRECDAIGADIATQLNEKTKELESIHNETQAVEEEKRKIEEEERKMLWMDYERAAQNYIPIDTATSMPSPTAKPFIPYKAVKAVFLTPTPTVTPTATPSATMTPTPTKRPPLKAKMNNHNLFQTIIRFFRDLFYI
jgi:hypothetical protein